MQDLQKRKVLDFLGLFHLSFWVVIGLTPFWVSCEKEEEPIIVVERGEPENLTGLLESNRTLRNKYSASDAPDYVVTGICKVLNATLKIEAGVIIYFAEDAGLEISDNAILEVCGNEDNKVVFTGLSPIPGFWRGILIQSERPCFIKHAEIHFGGGRRWSNEVHQSNLLVAGKDASSPTNMSVDVHDCLIADSPQFGISFSTALKKVSLQRNVFRRNGLSPVICPSYLLSDIDVESSDYTENGHNGIFLINGLLVLDDVFYGNYASNSYDYTTTHLKKLPEGGSYRGEILINNPVTLDPGVIIEIPPGYKTSFSKGVTAIGTPDEKIIFRNIPGKGNFARISLTFINLSSTMEHCIISNGGSDEIPPANEAPASISVGPGHKLYLSNSLIQNSESCGVALYGTPSIHLAEIIQSNNTFLNNTGEDICD